MTEPAAPEISVPMLADETARAYNARVGYLTMGAGRSLDKLRQSYGKSAAYTRQLECWSAQHGWVQSALLYDQTLAHLAARAHEAAYRAALLAHRTDADKHGRMLCAVAITMLAQLQAQAKTIEYTPAALGAIGRALTTGLDLRAHALDLDRLLPTLDSAEPAAQLLSAEARTEADVRAILATLPADVRAAIIALASDAEPDT